MGRVLIVFAGRAAGAGIDNDSALARGAVLAQMWSLLLEVWAHGACGASGCWPCPSAD